MKKQIFMSIFGLLLLVGCSGSVEAPEISESEITKSTDIIPEEAETTIIEEVPQTEIAQEAPSAESAPDEEQQDQDLGWGNTPDYFPDTDTANTENSQREIREAVFQVENATGDIHLIKGSAIEGQPCEDILNGCMVNGKELEQGDSENIVVKVRSYNSADDGYSASYRLLGSHFETERFYIEPDQNGVSDGEITKYSLDYNGYRLSASTDNALEISMSYRSFIVLSEQKGYFELLVFPYMDDANVNGYERVYIRGTADEPTHIALSIEDHLMTIESNREIDFENEIWDGEQIVTESTGPVQAYQLEF